MFNKFLIIFLIILFALPLTLLADKTSIAAKGTEGAITGFAKEFGKFNQNFIGFLEWLFPIMLSVAAILAVLTIIFAGFKWMAGAISPPEVDAAKKMIAAAIGGLILALSSWLILNTINPNLIKLEKPDEIAEFQPPTKYSQETICINLNTKENLDTKYNECFNSGGTLIKAPREQCFDTNETAFVCLKLDFFKK